MPWAPNYADTGFLRDYLRIPDNDDDAELNVAIAAASRVVDVACNRQFGRVDVVEAREYVVFHDRHRGRHVAEIDDLMTTVGLVVADTSGANVTSTVELWPRNAPQKGRPWTELVVPAQGGSLTITARWGWTAVPTTIEQATLLQAARFFKRRDAPFGVAGSADLGSELRLFNKIDPDVEVMIGSCRRWWATA